MTVQGRILKPDGTVFNSSSVDFKVRIVTPTNGCVLYEETQNSKDLSASNGLFAVTLNDGTGTVNAPTTYSLRQALSNSSQFDVNSSYCGSGSGTISWTPSDTSERKVIVYFKDHSSGSWEVMPTAHLSHTAYAVEASQVAGFTANNLLRVADSGVPQSIAALTSANFTELQALVGGTSTQYVKSSGTTGLGIPVVAGAPASPSQGSFWYDSTSNSVKFYTGSTTKSVITANQFNTSGGCTADKTLTYNSATDTFTCTSIGIGASQITSGTISSSVLPTSATFWSDQGSGKISYSGGNVGIGTTNPGNQLEVKGSNPFVVTNTTGSFGGIRFQVNNVDRYTAALNSSGDQIYSRFNSSGTWQNDVLAMKANGDFSLNGATLYGQYSTGYVGIGTTSPTSPLTVSSNNDYPVAINSSGSSGTNGYSHPIVALAPSLAAGETYGVNIGQANSARNLAYFGFVYNSSGSNSNYLTMGLHSADHVLNITGAKNVGIGTTTPSSTLQVNGTFNGLVLNGNYVQTNDATAHNYKIATLPASTLSTYDHLHLLVTLNSGWGSTANTNYDLIFANRNSFAYQYTVRGAAASPNARVVAYNNAGAIDIYLQFPGTFSYTNASYTILEAQQETVYASPTDVGATPVGTLVFDTSSAAYPPVTVSNFAGNVGIGTTSPTSVLHLKAGTNTAGTAPLKFTAGTNLTTPEAGAVEFDGTNLFFTDSGNTRRTIAASSSGTTNSFTTISNTSGNLTLSPVTSTGSVLVTSGAASSGTASGALVVTGGVGVSGDIYTGASINAGSTITAATSVTSPQLYGSSSSGGSIKIDGTSHATKGPVLLNSAGGNVGIGTTSPSTSLEISNASGGINIRNSGESLRDWMTIDGGGHGTFGLLNSSAVTQIQLSANPATSNYILQNLGIGTTSPATPLHVRGATDSNLRFQGLANIFYMNAINDAGNTYIPLVINSSQAQFNSNSTSTALALTQSGTGNAATIMGGNVGIGTTSPSEKLQVNSGNVYTNGGAFVTTGSFSFSGWNASVAGSGVSGSSYLSLKTNATDRLYINDGGSVGVGTTAPIAQLDVSGGLKAGLAPSAGTTLTSAATAGDTTLTVASTAGFPSSGILYVVMTGSPFTNEVVSYTGTTATTFTGVTRGLYGTTASAFASGVSVDACLLCVSNASNVTPRLMVTPARGVAIGSPPPGWLGTNGLFVQGQAYAAGGYVAGSVYRFGASTVTMTGNSVGTSADYWSIATNSVERMRVDGSGNFGIGTTAPVGKFDISNGGAEEIQFTPGFAANVNYLKSYSQSGAVYNDLIVDSKRTRFFISGAEGMRLDNNGGLALGSYSGVNTPPAAGAIVSGSVGIGTASPGYKLDVQGGGVNTSGAYTNVSDGRLKKEILPLDDSLQKVLQLQSVSYYWKNQQFDSSKQIGFVAQEVEKIYPELVKTDGRGYKAMNYVQLISPVVAAIKEFYGLWFSENAKIHEELAKKDREIASLQEQSQKQAQELETLKKRLEKLETPK